MMETGVNVDGGVFSRKSICFVTGASRGLGKAIALKFASTFKAPITFVLIARNQNGLTSVAELLRQVDDSLTTTTPKTKLSIKVCTRAVDLSDLTTDYFALFSGILQELDSKPGDYEQAIIVHNAGSLGDVSKNARAFNDRKELASYYSLNLTNVIALNSQFMQTFSEDKTKFRLVINISSICALEAFKTWSVYCTGKAARDMFFSVLGKEEQETKTTVLNYAPGPLITDMGDEARTKTADPDIRKMFEEFKRDGKNLECDTSAERLMEILWRMKFTSGQHVDFFDEI
ncbi:sepiapterin reductase-like [Liolophura sinensis]|uniref:sepiapterin reductase-like n=1 Tax=Liolophura sinensis TaxID=3198878 RepID=UPI0031594137